MNLSTLKASISGLQTSNVLPLLSTTTSKSVLGKVSGWLGSPHTICTPFSLRLAYWLYGAFFVCLPCKTVLPMISLLEGCQRTLLFTVAHLISIVQDCDFVPGLEQLLSQVEPNKSMTTALGVGYEHFLANNPKLSGPTLTLSSRSQGVRAAKKARPSSVLNGRYTSA